MSKIVKRLERLVSAAQKSPVYHEEGLKLQVSEALWALKELNHTSKKEMAKRLGVSPAYMTKIMGDGANFTLRSLSKIAVSFNCRWELTLHRRNIQVCPRPTQKGT